MKRPRKKRSLPLPGLQGFLEQCRVDALALKLLRREIDGLDQRLRTIEEDRKVDDAVTRLKGDGGE